MSFMIYHLNRGTSKLSGVNKADRRGRKIMVVRREFLLILNHEQYEKYIKASKNLKHPFPININTIPVD